MSGSIRFDKTGFDRTMRDLAVYTSRPLDQFVTSRLWHIAKTARDATPTADRAKIARDLVAKTTVRVSKKTGKLSFKRKASMLAYAIVLSRLRKAGKPGIAGKELGKAARKLIGSRLRAVGSLRAGWNRALGILGSAIRQFTPRIGPKVKAGSLAKPARPGWKPTAILEYILTVKDGGGRAIDRRVVSALERGFVKEHSEIIPRLEQKVREAARKAGAI